MQIISFQGHGKPQAKPVNPSQNHSKNVQGQLLQGSKPQAPKGHAGDSFVRNPSK